MTVYHVETKQAYDELMIELEEKGCKWVGGKKLTDFDEFSTYGIDTYVYDECCKISVSSGNYFKEHHSDEPVIEYKAKGENMTQEEMKQKLHENALDVFVKVQPFYKSTSETEADLQEAKSSAKKLIEKIDEYLETLKPKFKVGDYAVELGKYITKIEKIDDGMPKGCFYMPGNNHFSPIKDSVSSYIARCATPSEIEEYEVALTFHKHGRKPFELKKGDLIKKPSGNFTFILNPENYTKEDFLKYGWEFRSPVEEVNEWLENK